MLKRETSGSYIYSLWPFLNRLAEFPANLVRQGMKFLGARRANQAVPHALVCPGNVAQAIIAVLEHAGRLVDCHGSDHHGEALALSAIVEEHRCWTVRRSDQSAADEPEASLAEIGRHHGSLKSVRHPAH